MFDALNWVDSICNILLAPDHIRLEKELKEMCTKHFNKGNTTMVFKYGGKFYGADNLTKQNLRNLRPYVVELDRSLYTQMELYLNDKAQVDLDEKLIKQHLSVLLKYASTEQEARNRLPDFIVDILPMAKQYARTEAFEACHDSDTVRRTDRFLNKVYIYSAGRLIYS